jgi:hypothetical protein
MGKHGGVTEAGSLRDAVTSLYSSDPGEFTERRKALVARAREGGDKALAKTIAGLRKPTRSAWVVNMLVRADRFAVSRMTALGDDLRDAERAMDGTRIRELSRRRRELMASLLQQAFDAAGQESPPAALRDEVTSTLTAALADPQVAEQLRAGTLVRAVYREGFAILEAEDPAAWAGASASRGPATRGPATRGPAPADGEGITPASSRPARRPGRQVTAPEPSRPGQTRTGRGRPASAPGGAGRGGRTEPGGERDGRPERGDRAPGEATAGRAAQKGSRQERAARVRADRERAARDRAEQDRLARERAREEQASRARRERELRQAALAEARQAAADANRAATAAAREEEDAAKSVRALTEQLAQARQRHAEARVNARQAQATQRRAQERLTRLRD